MALERPVFVLAWVTEHGAPVTPMGRGGRVLFVEHPERGWEIPGGYLENDESPEQALLRELKEETGLEGTILAWNQHYYPNGWVAHVMVEPSMQEKWNVKDRSVASVRWWDKTPPVRSWTPEEFEDLANHFAPSTQEG